MKKLGKIASILFVCLLFAGVTALAAEHGSAPAKVPAGTHTAKAADAHDAPDWDLFAVDPGLMMWTVICFVILLIVLWRFAWRPMQDLLEKRTESIDGNIKEAAKTREDAVTYLEESKEKVNEAKKEAQERVDEAKRDADVLKKKILDEAAVDADAERDRGARDAKMLQDKAFEDFWKEAATVTTELAGRIIRKSVTPEDHRGLVDGFIEEYKKVEK